MDVSKTEEKEIIRKHEQKRKKALSRKMSEVAKQRMVKLSPERRIEIAKLAVAARERKKREREAARQDSQG